MEAQALVLGGLILLWDLLVTFLGLIPGYLWTGLFLFIGISYHLNLLANHLTHRLDSLESKIDDTRKPRGGTWVD